MGSCLCKEKTRRHNENRSARGSRPHRREEDLNGSSQSSELDAEYDLEGPSHLGRRMSVTNYVGNDVKDLIRQTLKVIRSLVNNEQEPPASLLKLNMIAEREKGWLLVVESLIDTVPDDDSLGPAVITLFLDECPLPSKDTVHRLLCSLRLDQASLSDSSRKQSSLAEKLAGSSSVAMCNSTTLTYLISRISPPFNHIRVVLFALLALEKFAQTSENQFLISRTLENSAIHPLKQLEHWRQSTSDTMKRQVGFCATWALDNIFVTPNRAYAYETTDVSHINVMLNHEDVSEYLKIGPDGLEARCDVSSFESVRCTFAVLDGVWFYEATVFTPGVMQIGFATKRSRFLNHEGYGIGDDEYSVAYDGCRQLLWHNASSTRHEHEPWCPGDVLGCLLNIAAGTVMFFLNGQPLQKPHLDFLKNRPIDDGVFAAASFMSFQQCRFNFGAEPFKYPPDVEFKSFNDGGATLTVEQKTILPRRRRLELLQREPIPDDYCTICYSNPGDTVLSPCLHGGICKICSMQLDHCPLCRQAIENRIMEEEALDVSVRRVSGSTGRLSSSSRRISNGRTHVSPFRFTTEI
ncbi:SPRY domain protein [Dictyocaulus viviparus]|uniref:SPRY domain protein n=1 Tax=Dictyocaulus viviparus TaxID=29172 RepID=A0A0D8Y4J1_DICVI|nr:SPRY domain protein [Dictyocaulus viviparus]